MSKKKFDVICVLDKSGSMYPLVQDTIGGYNNFIKEQKSGEGEKRVSLILFDTDYKVLYDGKKIDKVKPLSWPTYNASGNTALRDALGKAIATTETRHKEDGAPDKTVFMIITDGMENSSKEYSDEQIKQMVQQKQDDGWTFFFLGANIDSFAVGQRYGINEETIANYKATATGTRNLYSTVSEGVSMTLGGDLDALWRDGLNDDEE